jgi:hypothetical protein
MFNVDFCDISGDATISHSGKEVGTASFANAAQRILFNAAIDGGARPAKAAEISGGIYLPHEHNAPSEA